MSRNYFKVVAESDAEKAISEFSSEYEKTVDSWFDFAKKYGAKSLYSGNRLSGIMFDEEDVKPPKGWISSRNMHPKAFKPTRKKCCMDAYKELKSLKSKPDGCKLATMLGIDAVFTSSAMHLPTFEKIKDVLILSLHEKSELPEGIEKLKMSEYWELKESA